MLKKSLQSHSYTKKGFNMSLKITSILLLLSCLNMTLADQGCKVKLYAERDYRGNDVSEIYESKKIKHGEVKSLLIFGDCKWDMYRYCIKTFHFHIFIVTYFYCLCSNKKHVSRLVPGREYNEFSSPMRPPYFFHKKSNPFPIRIGR